mmetsp:Transcript_14902/g.27971  ORF Transcript_14902/g.27971 Transcript_14902/m.27971 type:complete len:106 (+) Transcript_14902:55-372(+)
MGCAGSSVWKLERSSSFNTHNAANVFPPGAPAPPDRDTHDAYVNNLNRYLGRVQKKPQQFVVKVESRRLWMLNAPGDDALSPSTTWHKSSGQESPGADARTGCNS